MIKTWHEQHEEALTSAQKIADALSAFIGSWRFIIAQVVLMSVWFTINIIAYYVRWDPYPFVLLNLLFSIQAAFTGPVIMMSQNRQSQRDRLHAKADYEVNLAAKKEIEDLQISLARIENTKLDEILTLLKKS